MEWITSLVLLRFVNEFCEDIKHNLRIGSVFPHYIARVYTIYVVPMLNPDGVNYQIHGIEGDNPLYERVLKMNGGCEDLTHWQANARGVDLNHNYNAGFWEYKEIEKETGIENGAPGKYSGEAPESEPETAALCNLIRCSASMSGVLTLHTQGEEIFYQKTLASSKSAGIAKHLAALCGYRLSSATGSAAYGGLTDWCVASQNIPAFTVECGRGKNPLPQTAFSSIYCRLRQMLFSFPSLL
jgi:g-D-glutamyl-meso-diaminopimelate peptidase